MSPVFFIYTKKDKRKSIEINIDFYLTKELIHVQKIIVFKGWSVTEKMKISKRAKVSFFINK